VGIYHKDERGRRHPVQVSGKEEENTKKKVAKHVA
jgi:hypothetical protein